MTYEEFISAEYNMKHKKIGRAMVINNKNFRMKDTSNPERQRKTRKHTDQDRDAIVKVLKDLGFDGIYYKIRGTKQPDPRMVFENVHKQDLLNYLSDGNNNKSTLCIKATFRKKVKVNFIGMCPLYRVSK